MGEEKPDRLMSRIISKTGTGECILNRDNTVVCGWCRNNCGGCGLTDIIGKNLSEEDVKKWKIRKVKKTGKIVSDINRSFVQYGVMRTFVFYIGLKK
jgi:hypothetical protein